MTYKQYGPPFSPADFMHFADGFLLELRVSYGQHLVHDQNLWFQVCRDSKTKTDLHTG